jgi:hypothetical protein
MEERKIEDMIEAFADMRERAAKDLDELQQAIKVIEKQARRLEREIDRYDTLLNETRTGKLEIRLSPRPPRDRFVDMSIPDAAAEAIENLERPLHVRELLDVLEAGGKAFKARRPTVSIASALIRDPRFVRVEANTFDLRERTQRRLPIEE